MPILIHNKSYVTVAERVQMAHAECKQITIFTEILPIPDAIVVKATVTTPKGVFTGISAANPAKLIEKMSPYEVAETSAVGRALGFAGYGAIDSIASAEEITKAKITENKIEDKKVVIDKEKDMATIQRDGLTITHPVEKDSNKACSVCKGTIRYQKVIDYSKQLYGKILCYDCQKVFDKKVEVQA